MAHPPYNLGLAASQYQVLIPLETEALGETPIRNDNERCLENTGICALSILASIIAITGISAQFSTDPRQKKGFSAVAFSATAFAVAILILGLARRYNRAAS